MIKVGMPLTFTIYLYTAQIKSRLTTNREIKLKKNAMMRCQQNLNRMMILCDGSVKLQSCKKKPSSISKATSWLTYHWVGSDWRICQSVREWATLFSCWTWRIMRGWLGTVGSRLRKLSCCRSLCSSPRGKAIDRKRDMGQHGHLKTEGKVMGGL